MWNDQNDYNNINRTCESSKEESDDDDPFTTECRYYPKKTSFIEKLLHSPHDIDHNTSIEILNTNQPSPYELIKLVYEEKRC